MSTNQPTAAQAGRAAPSLDDVRLPPNLAALVKTMRDDPAVRAYIEERAAPYRTPAMRDVSAY